jgi:hypothetical protein
MMRQVEGREGGNLPAPVHEKVAKLVSPRHRVVVQEGHGGHPAKKQFANVILFYFADLLFTENRDLWKGGSCSSSQKQQQQQQQQQP